MSPFYVFRNGPKEVDGLTRVIPIHADTDLTAELKPAGKDALEVETKSFNAFVLTESARDFSGKDIVKAESFFVYDGEEVACEETVIFSREELKTREDWLNKRNELLPGNY